MDQELIRQITVILGKETPDDGYMTFRELREASGFGERRLRDALRGLHEQGKLETAFTYRQNLAGYRSSLPGYRLKT